MNLSLRIILQKPPVNVHFGLQKGSGSKYETVQTQRSGEDDLVFNLAIEIKGDKQRDAMPDFKGPFVQGPATSRFIYIDIGSYAGHNDLWDRRLKIPLTGITWDMINEVNQAQNTGLITHVLGTGKDGGPNCATVKPFDGWKVSLPS